MRQPLTQTLPDYWRPQLEEKIARIHKLQSDAGCESASFAVISDIHVIDNAWHSAAVLEEVLRRCAIPYFINAGDTISGAGICSKESLFGDFLDYREAFRAIEHKCLVVEGNHDPAYSTFEAPRYYVQSLTQDELNEHIFRPMTLYPNRTFGHDISYYFADDTVHKMRYVILNAHDAPSQEIDDEGIPKYDKFRLCAVRQEQLSWFANVALDVPSPDWTVTLSTHEVPIAECAMNSQDLIFGIINAFKNHGKFSGHAEFSDPGYNTAIDVDYTGRGGNFTLWVGGHTHWDVHGQIEGVNCMCILNDSMHKSAKSEFQKVRGTDTEQAFDVFTVDKRRRKIFVTRIGAGVDRVLDY